MKVFLSQGFLNSLLLIFLLLKLFTFNFPKSPNELIGYLITKLDFTVNFGIFYKRKKSAKY